MNVNTKKRSRSEKSSVVQHGDQSIPIIQGISATLGPLLVQGIKAQKKVFSYMAMHGISINQTTLDSQKRFTSNDNVLDRIQQRQDLLPVHENDSPTDELGQLSTCAQDNLNLFLKQLEKESRGREEDPLDPHSSSKACLNFLWDMMTDSSCSLVLQRSAFHIIASILYIHKKSCDWLFSSQDGSIYLKRFIDSVQSLMSNPSTQPKEIYHSLQYPYQIMTLFHDLLRKYSRIYPKLIVTKRLLKEQLGFPDDHPVDISLSSNQTTMAKLRSIRDTALELGEKECIRVQRLIQVADDCFHILVPRYGSDGIAPCSTREATATMDDAEELESIHWQDGDTDADDLHDLDDEIDHTWTVNQTLNLMSVRGTFSDGVLQVNLEDTTTTMSNQVHYHHQTRNDTNPIYEKLEKCIWSLSKRHLPRIASWIDALQNADSLTHQTWDINSETIRKTDSLLLLPDILRNKKHPLLSSFKILKQDIISVSRSAAKIGVLSANKPRSSSQANLVTDDNAPSTTTTRGNNASVGSETMNVKSTDTPQFKLNDELEGYPMHDTPIMVQKSTRKYSDRITIKLF